MLTSTNVSQLQSASRSLIQAGLHHSFLLGVVLVLGGCSSLLPNTKQESKSPWRSYAEAQQMFEKIVPGKTTLSELKALAVDPERTPNITVLAHADLLRRLVPIGTNDFRLLDPGLQECVAAAQSCFGYEIEQAHLDRQRVGGFLLDFLSFKRTVDISGWQFDAVVVIKNDIVIYKLWSGKPNIYQTDEERIPLGPLQGRGTMLFR